MIDGACVFHRASGSARCTLHHALGHAALPLACRQFPRVVVVDPRGVSVTLSHYCPTAAAMLETTAPIAIVTDADAFPPGGEYVGLDVRDGLPPALRPDMLMGWEDWWHWEEQAVALLSAVDDAADALARLAHAVEFTRDWRPADGPLRDRIDAAFQSARHDTPARVATACRSDDAMADVVAAVPDGMRGDARRAIGTRGARVPIHVHRHLLIAHAFANWTAHIGEGLRTWLLSIETAHALLLSGLGVRDVDLLLRHLVDPRALARRWVDVEGNKREV